MRDEVQLVFDPLPGDALERLIEDNVIAYNLAATGSADWYPVGYFLRNARGEWLGGCIGNIWGGWLHVRWLWVAAAIRRRGHATRLMDAAEAMGAERGCGSATLETHSVEALAFYRARLYQVFGTLEDYPPGFTKYFLSKRLS
ncbi:MAG: GNAT family N-acetyltransferase [Acetobacteraceae bacterium]|nr:GNAT family N-acetyltransferase [Acetobacteraceae bacterium]